MEGVDLAGNMPKARTFQSIFVSWLLVYLTWPLLVDEGEVELVVALDRETGMMGLAAYPSWMF